jgi:hypothetical protein
MIAGIDPGTTVGIAVVDLEGKVVLLESHRNPPSSKVINSLLEFSPVLIATDVNPVPAAVKKIAASLQAGVYSPPEDLPVKEKVELTRSFHPGNNHQRDALAAALKAFHQYSSKIRKARRLARQKKREIELAALRETRFSDVVESKVSRSEEKSVDEVSGLRKELGLEKKRVKALEKENKELKKKVSSLAKRLSRKTIQLVEAREKIPKPVEPEPEDSEEEEKKDLSSEEVEKLFKEYKGKKP